MASILQDPDSLRSDDDDGQDQSRAAPQRKRSTRACDQCRKVKGKCERTSVDADKCKTCTLTNISCTYSDPGHKRGPPKGYVQAIEHRWQLAESIIGAIMGSSDAGAQRVIATLRQDKVAKEVLKRIDGGPFGPSGRLQSPAEASKDVMFASILESSGKGPGGEENPPKSHRQSRASREFVSSVEDPIMLTAPTMGWQDGLIVLLAQPAEALHESGNPLSARTQDTVDPAGVPYSQRRRLEELADAAMLHQSRIEQQPKEPTEDTFAQVSDELGQLSFDEHEQVRFHGKASGMYLLPRSDRGDDRYQGGMWKLPMARIWPMASVYVDNLNHEKEVPVEMPPLELQDNLIKLYFTYVHPHFPVIHKRAFMSAYKRRDYSLFGSSDSLNVVEAPPGSDSQQTISKLLLLSMFSISARFLNPPMEHYNMWEAGCDHLHQARALLRHTFYRSQPSTCQALLLLGYREFGIGSTEQGWIFSGMAIRMAFDLGLNRNADKWESDGSDLFSLVENQTRKKIWWICCIIDQYASIHMGRPSAIGENDYDIPLPAILKDEDEELWTPMESNALHYYRPLPGVIYSVFRAMCSLCMIFESITTLIYPVRYLTKSSPLSHREALEARLDNWLINLDIKLRYEANSGQQTPPPNVLVLHIQYWTAVLLLHRAFVPNWVGPLTPEQEADSVGTRAFDLSQNAASHISTIATIYENNFGMRHCPPSMSSYLFSAGVMHVIALTIRPSDLQGSFGLQQCLHSLKEMELTWPSAQHAYQLLHGSTSRFDAPRTLSTSPQVSPKRAAAVAFADNEVPESQEGSSSMSSMPPPTAGMYHDVSGVQDLSSMITASMLGLDVPGYPSTSSSFNALHSYNFWGEPIQQVQQQGMAGGYEPDLSGSISGTGEAAASVPYAAHGVGGNIFEDWMQEPQSGAQEEEFGRERHAM